MFGIQLRLSTLFWASKKETVIPDPKDSIFRDISYNFYDKSDFLKNFEISISDFLPHFLMKISRLENQKALEKIPISDLLKLSPLVAMLELEF